MLTVSPAASAAIETLLNSPQVPEGAGMRFQLGPETEEGVGIAISLVEGPGPDDVVVPTAPGAAVYLDPDTVELLDDKVLDAEIQDEGVAFSIEPQARNGATPG